MTSSLGSGRIDDSTAMSTTIPGYPIPRNRSSNHWMNDSSIEAMLSEQGDESCAAEGRVTQLRGRPRPNALDQRERLGTALAERDQEAAVRGELLDERRWNLGPTCGHQDRVVGSVRAPPERTVAQQDRHVGDARFAQGPLCGEREGLYALDGEDRARHGPEQRGLIPRTRPDLQHPFLPLEAQCLEITGLHERL